MGKRLRILVSPLDWGLGHATRCIPIITHLLDRDCEVMIAADGYPLALLREEFPGLEFIQLKGYGVRYSRLLPASLATALQIPIINMAVSREHKELEALRVAKKIDAVISDNRYGLWNSNIPCIIITHQLNVQSSFMSDSIRRKVRGHLEKFNECWIPDYEEGSDLSGALSHPAPGGIKTRYIGLLSRFEPADSPKAMERDLLVLLSGPEPQRSVLEMKVIKQINELGNIRASVIQGKPGGKSLKLNDRVELIAHLPAKELFEKIVSSKAILARPGYSTIMDLAAVGGKGAIFVATPGQTEQEYLAMYMESEGIGVMCRQRHFSLREAWVKVFQSKGFNSASYKRNYKQALNEWLQMVKA